MRKLNLFLLLIAFLVALTACSFNGDKSNHPPNCFELDFEHKAVSPAGDCRATGILVNEFNDSSGWLLKNDAGNERSHMHISAFDYIYSDTFHELKGRMIKVEGRYEYDQEVDFFAMSEIYVLLEVTEAKK